MIATYSPPFSGSVPPKTLELPNFDSVWGMLTVGAPPVQMLFDRVGADGEERVREALATIVEERFGSGPVRITNAATLGSGTVG